MKKYLAVLAFSIMVLFYSVPSYSSGVITHIGQAQDIINMAKAGNPAIPSDIASIITKSPSTERACSLAENHDQGDGFGRPLECSGIASVL